MILIISKNVCKLIALNLYRLLSIEKGNEWKSLETKIYANHTPIFGTFACTFRNDNQIVICYNKSAVHLFSIYLPGHFNLHTKGNQELADRKLF